MFQYHQRNHPVKSARKSVEMCLGNIPKEPSFIKSGVEGRGNEILIYKFNIDFS